MQCQDRVSVLEAEVKRLKDAELRRQSTNEPRNEYEGESPTRAHQQSPLFPSPHTDGATEIRDDERGELLLNTPREHAVGGNTLPPPVMVGVVEEEHVVDGNNLPVQHNDGGYSDIGGEDVVEGVVDPTSTITTSVKNNPRTRYKSVSTRTPYETRTYTR